MWLSAIIGSIMTSSSHVVGHGGLAIINRQCYDKFFLCAGGIEGLTTLAGIFTRKSNLNTM